LGVLLCNKRAQFIIQSAIHCLDFILGQHFTAFLYPAYLI